MSNKLFTRNNLLAAAAFAFLGLTGCNPEEDVNPDGALNASTVNAAKGEAGNVKMLTGHYILVGSTEQLPAGLAKQIADMGGELTSSIDELGIATASSADPSFAARASKISGLRSVVRDLEVQWYNPEAIKTVEVDENAVTATANSNRYFDFLWGHQAVKAPQAWAAGVRGAGVRVAVLDGGFDFTHPDLRANIDLDASASYVPGESRQFNPLIAGRTFSHGTHVAGTIAALDNTIGSVGVAPDAQLVLVKVLGDRGTGQFSWIINGIYHAAASNVDVINMSLGATLPRNGRFQLEDGSWVNDTKAVQELVIALNRATGYATKQGVTVISSAGNDANNGNTDKSMMKVPASCTGVISISSTGPMGWATNMQAANLDRIASYTNIGTPDVTFAAPGGDFAYPGNETTIVSGILNPVWAFDMVFSLSMGGYTWSAGTSMASPHAAGVAALIISKNGGKMDPAHVLAKLRATADDLGKPGRDPYYGYGRVNALRAVTE
ncbi:S8 family peptidase [Pontibacter indicus]|uniref:Subtilase family protein n=1 Tax=Pontibacter indicus TaxID=1317125 RepID=A0A1R3WGX6_9BACT|nr:S8 family serine peptidase [Pontibacter indicus]SIT77165.1 Subtilase family protein [Pontibacter indicus]